MAKEDGYKNIKPPRSSDEARKNGKKGGIASGKARLAKKQPVSMPLLPFVIKDKDGKSTTIKDIVSY